MELDTEITEESGSLLEICVAKPVGVADRSSLLDIPKGVVIGAVRDSSKLMGTAEDSDVDPGVDCTRMEEDSEAPTSDELIKDPPTLELAPTRVPVVVNCRDSNVLLKMPDGMGVKNVPVVSDPPLLLR